MGRYTDQLRKRVQIRGEKIGFCAICGEKGPLSRDHVPPKKCNNLNDVEIRALMPSYSTSKISAGTTSQRGTHFKTLCSVCNNTRLGVYYDPALVDFSNEVTSVALGAKSKNILLPRKVHSFIRPQRIARAVVGHVLAGLAVEESMQGLFDSSFSNSLREYFLNDKANLPSNIDIYYWLYPSRRQVLVKHMGKSVVTTEGKRETVVGHVFKFLPFGFWLLHDSPRIKSDTIKPLLNNKSISLDQIEQVEIDLYNTPSLDFPETPLDNEFVLLNSEYAVEANRKHSKN